MGKKRRQMFRSKFTLHPRNRLGTIDEVTADTPAQAPAEVKKATPKPTEVKKPEPKRVEPKKATTKAKPKAETPKKTTTRYASKKPNK